MKTYSLYLKSMLNGIINTILNTLGYSLEKITKPIPDEFWVDKDEIDALSQDLVTFSKLLPRSIGNECGVPVDWSDPTQARKYLSDERITFYHKILALITSHNITFHNKSILDSGSGAGYLLRLIARNYPNTKLYGFDPYKEMSTLAKHLCPSAKIYTDEHYFISNETFDVILCTEVLEHLIQPDVEIVQLLKLLNTNGELIITVPDGRNDTFTANGMYSNKKGYWGHINFWSIESWNVFIQANCHQMIYEAGSLDNGLYAIISNKGTK